METPGDTDAVVIEASNTKTVLLVLVGIGFVALGAWFVSLDPETLAAQPRFNSPAFVHALGYVTVAFFGLCVAAAIWRLFSSKPGLILDREGLTVHGFMDDLFVPWRDVAGFGVYEAHRQRMLVVGLKNPEGYVERGGKLRRMVARANYSLCGSPVVISSNTLRLDFESLIEVVGKFHARWSRQDSVPEASVLYFKEAQDIWSKYVPNSGQAQTVQGELLRAVEKLRDEATRNGNMNWDEGFEILLEYLRRDLLDEAVYPPGQIKATSATLARLGDFENPCTDDRPFDELGGRVVEYFRHYGSKAHAPDPSLRR